MDERVAQYSNLFLAVLDHSREGWGRGIKKGRKTDTVVKEISDHIWRLSENGQQWGHGKKRQKGKRQMVQKKKNLSSHLNIL